MVLVVDTGYLVLVVGEVHADIVTEVLTDLVVPGESNLNTGVLNITTVDHSRVGTHDTYHCTAYEPVLRLLNIPVEVNAQAVAEQACVET